MEKTFQIASAGFLDGYISDPLFCKPSNLSYPSQNCRINQSGRAEKRLGYLDTTWSLGGSSPATSFYNDRYDLTFFATGTKVYYIDHGDANRVVDTGLTMTAGTTTRFSEYAGDIYLTNTTDGLRQIMIMKLTSACTTGDTHIHVDTDGNARMKFFSLTSGNLRIRGTNEAYTQPTTGSVSGTASATGLIKITTSAPHGLLTGCQVVIASVGGTVEANGTWTITKVDATSFTLDGSSYSNAWTSGGVWTYNLNGLVVLTGTASADYPSLTTAIVVSDISSTRPKGSKVTFWKERMSISGCITDPTVGKADANVYFSKFALSTSPQNIINFSLDGEGGSESELVGKSGAITNIIPTKSNIYILKKSEVYSVSVSDVNAETGSSPPQLLTDNYGCVNEDSACEMNGNLVWITNNKRILRTQFQVFTTGSVALPDESFDIAIRNDLNGMDEDQSNAIAFYHRGKKLLYCQVSINSQPWTFVFDNNIGKWLPPDKNKLFKSYFERKGDLYATAISTPTIYEMDSGTNDNGILIDCRIASGIFQATAGRVTCAWDEVEMGGIISQPASIQIQCPVDGQTSAIKNINGTAYSYLSGSTIGSQIGTMIGGQTSAQAVATWAARFDAYPSEGNQMQIITSSFDDGTYGINSFKITARSYGESIYPLS